MKQMFILILLSVFGFTIAYAQETIRGKVTDNEGNSLPGATVIIKGTTTGTVTDIDGNYTLNNVPSDATLVISFVGMKNREVAVRNRSNINLSLQESTQLEEVIVTTYGTTTKQSFTGAASVIKSEDLEKKQVSNITKTLRGAASGVLATPTSGAPGSSATIRIRGIGSLNASSAPLIVVDGVPYEGDIRSIDPSDIANYTILKDAASTALYGSRAANGVIMITTKKGKSGDTKIEVNYKHGFNERGFKDYETVDVPTYYRLAWEAIKNDQISSGSNATNAAQHATDEIINTYLFYNIYDVDDDNLILTDGSLNPNAQQLYFPDWPGEAMDNGNRQEINVSFSGGSDKLTYRLSLGHIFDEGIIGNSHFNRTNVRLDATDKINEWLEVGLNTKLGNFVTNSPISSGSAYSNTFQFIRNIAPIYTVYARNDSIPGQYLTDASGNKLFDYGDDFYKNNLRPQNAYSNENVVATTVLNERHSTIDDFSARLFTKFKFLDDFTFTTNYSADFYSWETTRHQNSEFGAAASFKGRTRKDKGRVLNLLFNQLLEYKKEFDVHSIKALLGHESSKLQLSAMDATRTGFPGPGIVELDNAAVAEGSGSSEDNYRLESYFSRFQYNYDTKYYFEGSFRTDGSSRFHKDSRWGVFWGISGAWRISEESFMDDNSWLDELKLKASYGSLGNDNINSFYAYQGQYTSSFFNVDRPGVFPRTLPTLELTWETSNTFDVGLEIEVFDRISANLDYYISKKSDLLFARPLAPSSGGPIRRRNENIADMENKGFEVEIDADVIRKDELEWNFSFNATWNKNEITSLPDGDVPRGIRQWSVGKSVFEFYTRDYAGVDPQTGKPLWYYKEIEQDANGENVTDANGDPVYTGNLLTTDAPSKADDFWLGTALPDVFGGFSSNLVYKGIDLNFSLAYQLGGQIYDNNYAGLMGYSHGSNLHQDLLNRWQNAGDVTNIPRISNDDVSTASSRFLTDASYLSLNDVTLGYHLPKDVLQRVKKVNFKDVFFYIHGTNLFLLSKRQGLIPFQDLDGTNDNVYSPIRTYSLGLRVKF